MKFAKTHPVHHAAAAIDSTVGALRGMKQMERSTSRAEMRNADIAAAAPDVRAWSGRLPVEMVHRLAEMDKES